MADKVFGDKLEWRLTNGQPTAAILRVWPLETDDEGVDHTVQELLVIKVTRAGGCRAGSVDARRPDANAAARNLADTVAAFRCGRDKPTHIGLGPS